MNSSATKAEDIGVQALLEGNRKLYNDDDYKDLTLLCGEDKIKVHKGVVCSRSDFFRAACKKGAFKEGEESVIDLSADNEGAAGNHPSVVRLMVEYLYTMDYDVKRIPRLSFALLPAREDRSLTTHAMVFSIADKYDIVGLKALANAKFAASFRYALDEDFASAIGVVYTTTPETVLNLRAIVHGRLTNPDFSGCLKRGGAVRAAVESVDGLAMDLLFEVQSNRQDTVVAGWASSSESESESE